MILRYRIGVIDDFRNEFSFVDYAQYPSGMKRWDASTSRGVMEKQSPTDSITVFLNFKKIEETKERIKANIILQELLEKAPIDLSEYKEYLIK